MPPSQPARSPPIRAQSIKRNPRPKLTRFLSAEEIDQLHRTLDRLVDERSSRQQQADIIRLLLLTGCRKGEILKLKWSEVDGDVLRLADTKTGPRTVWLNRASSAIVLRQPRTGSAYVFPSPANPARPRSDTPRLWDRARKEAGIEDVRIHDLRHTVASQAVARGVALSTVARMLGHSDPKMTLRYAHVSDRDVEAACGAHREGHRDRNGDRPGDRRSAAAALGNTRIAAIGMESSPGEFHPEDRVAGGGHPPPAPTERRVQISRTALFKG